MKQLCTKEIIKETLNNNSDHIRYDFDDQLIELDHRTEYYNWLRSPKL